MYDPTGDFPIFILIVAAVGIIGFLLTAGIAFGIAGSYQID